MASQPEGTTRPHWGLGSDGSLVYSRKQPWSRQRLSAATNGVSLTGSGAVRSDSAGKLGVSLDQQDSGIFVLLAFSMAQPDLRDPLRQQQVELSHKDPHWAGCTGGRSLYTPQEHQFLWRDMTITRLVQTSGLLGNLMAAVVLSKTASGAMLSRKRPQPV